LSSPFLLNLFAKIFETSSNQRLNFEYKGGEKDKRNGYHCQQFCTKIKIVLFSQKHVDDMMHDDAQKKTTNNSNMGTTLGR
jgi:hypothetical protein